MIRERKREHPCVVIFINQMRKHLNVKFGSNEGQSGGHAMMHEFSLLFRCGKQTMAKDKDAKYFDSKREKYMASKHTCSIYKEKVFILSRSAKFIVIKENIPMHHLIKGQVDDCGLVVKYAQSLEFIKEAKKKKYHIECLNIGFDKIKDIRKPGTKKDFEISNWNDLRKSIFRHGWCS